MKACPACRVEYPDDKKFCVRCGARLVPSAAATPAAIAKRESYEARLREHPTSPELLTQFGAFLSEVGLHEDALVQLHKALEFEPGRASAIERLAEAYAAVGDPAAAARQWKALLARDPTNVSAQTGLARMRLMEGDQQGGADLLAEASRLAPGDIAILRQRRAVLKQLGPNRAGELAAVCSAIAAIDPYDAEAWETIASHHQATGEEAQALAAFEGLLRARPDHPRACFYVAKAAIDAGREEAAGGLPVARLLGRALAGVGGLRKDEANMVRLQWCDAQLRGGDTGEAFRDVLAQVAPDDLPPASRSLFGKCAEALGSILAEEGDLKAAIMWLRRAMEHGGGERVREVLLKAYLARGPRLAQIEGRRAAVENYEAGLKDLGGDPALLSARAALVSAAKRRNVFILTGIVLVCLAVAAVVFFSTGNLAIAMRHGDVVTVNGPSGSPVVVKPMPSGSLGAWVPSGRYAIHVERKACYAWDSTVVVHGGRTANIVPAPRPGFSRWVIRSTPKARLFVDGQELGTTPREIPRLPMGTHQLELRGSGLKVYSRNVYVIPGRDTTLEIMLAPVVVTAQVSNADDDAALYVNGREVIRTGWGRGPGGTLIGHAPGYSGWVDISSYCKPGVNRLRLWVWNAAVCCGVSGTFEVRLNGRTVLRRAFAEQSSTEGVKLDEPAEITIQGAGGTNQAGY